ncbi:SDR family oxidoreductase [Conexibacter sp. JD483]|uniref:SDR family NAD(P)-dependent oxidoreductase n=1 Tax=unclassified Conexibacter TaxID=2627773 RepID=UPI00272356BA|nr:MULTISPECIES: SDR family oxidoreductase [unclassified Conexibacter]MDO8186834.1 SDR family oxidoreductase [Conexibacter sp. CPCC 205706]MDO8197412.1 SDR family oxidoreductase [Conexibacter sp. CPCC 205762]MDR9371228.1 SDR family oxidoreductase [Conexibacter sp. JD483]
MSGADFAARDGVALVTGGSGGLGAEICRLLAERGSDVVLTYRSNSDAAEAVSEQVRRHGRDAQAHALDLTDADATAALLESVGSVHTLVHAAGPHIPQLHLSRVPPAQFAAAVNGEAVAAFNVVSAALPALREAGGSIVAVTTAATRRYPVRDGLSAAPKAAVEQLVRAIAAEEGRFGIRANCVGPGMLTDGMAQRLIAAGDLDEQALAITRRNIALRRFGSARDIAEAVCFLASDRAGFISGQLLDVDGGYGI